MFFCVLLVLALMAAAPPINSPHGVVAEVRGEFAVVVLRGAVAPRPGDPVRLGPPGPSDPPFAVTVSIAGNQVTVRLGDPARALGADRDAYFETAVPAPRLESHLRSPEPVRFPLPSALDAEQDLIRAATRGDAPTARIAMGRGINVDALGSRVDGVDGEGMTPLMRVAENGAFRTARRLLAEGAAMVLLHGWPETSHCWRGVMTALAGEYRMIAPDLRGFADTDKPEGNHDKATVAGDIRAIMDARGIDRVILVGHDIGARVAMRRFLAGRILDDN